MKNYQLKGFAGEAVIDYAKNLNPQQLEVVRGAEGPALVLAGAGSGKTRVLIYRLAYLLEKGLAAPNILLVTFTNKAAQEMIHRSEVLLKSSLAGLWAGTFHHIGNLILRREAEFLGYSANFTIVDRQDSQGLIEDCLQELGFLGREKLFPKKNIIANIRSLSASCQEEIDDIIKEFWPHIEEYTAHIKKVLAHYAKKKKQANIMDFDDLLLNWLKVLMDNALCQKYSKLFRYILVDEYQDTNHLQFLILQRLSSYHKNILVVGDDAQSIYSFRGARVKNLLEFPQTFKGTRVYKLETNYRSSPQILTLANQIIKHNINQFPKTLKAVRPADELPVAAQTHDIYQQAKFVTQRILELNQEGLPLRQTAVLFRSRFQALELEMELLKRNIPYVVRGGMRFFEQAHIKDIMAYLKITINPSDELSFKRAVCLHKGIGRNYAHKIWNNLFLEKKGAAAVKQALPQRARQGFGEFNLLLEQVKKIKLPEPAIRQLLTFYSSHCHLSFDNPEERIMDLEELAKMANSYPTIKSFILDLSSYEGFAGETRLSPSQKEDLLVLSTIHQAKGLEWEAVFIIGFTDYEFPHPKALESESALEEERRLFYVAVTRTKTQLYITYPQNKYTFKHGLIIARASKFLSELEPACFEEWNVKQN